MYNYKEEDEWAEAKPSRAEPTELGVEIYLYKSFPFKVSLSLGNMQLQNLIHDHFCTAENATSHITLTHNFRNINQTDGNL